MDGVMRNHALRLVVVSAARVHVAIEAWEITARNFQSNPMSGVKIVACIHRLKAYLDDLAGLHQGDGLVIAIPIPQTLDRLIEVVGPPVRIDIYQFDGHISV